MYEIDFLPVGDGQDSGDAIAIRFTRPDTGAPAIIVIDAGFKDDGEALVEHVRTYYGTDYVDLAILTHPDGDHIGGMGEVVRGLRVAELWLHRIGNHGGSSLPAAAAVEELIDVAIDHGTIVREAWAGASVFGDALTILGPTRRYYDQLVQEQVEKHAVAVGARTSGLLEAAKGLVDRVGEYLPPEVPLLEKETTPRNNSAMITMLTVDGKRMLFTADAGVPALERAWDAAEELDLAGDLNFFQIPHHGSRRNVSSALLDRIVGPPGRQDVGTAFVSVVPDSDKHPSGRVVNAHIRRGYRVLATAGNSIRHKSGDAPARPGWGPATPLSPMVEEEDEE